VVKKQLATRPRLARQLAQRSYAADGLWATMIALGTLYRKFLVGAEDSKKIKNDVQQTYVDQKRKS